MNNLKKSFVLILALCLLALTTGCGENSYDEYDNFSPSGVYVVDCINGENYETDIENADAAEKILSEFKKLDINTEVDGEMSTSYLYLRFYDEEKDTFLIFTIYDNGACCLGEDFEEFYVVTGGRQAYIDLCDLYAEYIEN